MDKPGDTHPPQKDLLLYVDGELSLQQAARVREHLEACWSCRLKAEEVQTTILSFADFCDSVLTPSAEPPPRGWRTFEAKLRGVAREAGTSSLLSRLRLSFSWPIAVSLAAGALLVFAVARFEDAPVVSANQLLTRAADSEASGLRAVTQPVVYQRLRVRTSGGLVTREVWRDSIKHGVKDTWNEPGDLPKIFAANRLDWQNPLSPAAYSNWRAGLRRKSENLVQDNGRLTLQIVALDAESGRSQEGRITEASLSVRVADYHAVAGRFHIQGREKTEDVEVIEADYAVVTLPAVSPWLFALSPSSPSPLAPAPSRPHPVVAPAAPSSVELADAEMAVRYTLHQLHADLGEAIEVEQGSRAVRVYGLPVSLERKREIQAALHNIPHLTVELRTEEEAARETPPFPTASANSPAAEVVSTGSPIAKQLQAYFGSEAAVEDFSSQAVRIMRALMAEAWAIRRLSERYTPAAEQHLNPSSRELLEEMSHDHCSALREKNTNLMDLMEPFLVSVVREPEPAPSTPASFASTAPAAKASLFATAQAIEQLTLGLLSGSDLPDPPEKAASDLLTALRGLKTQSEALKETK